VAGKDCLRTDDSMRDLTPNGYLHTLFTDSLISVQYYVLSYDICEFASAQLKVLAENLTSKGEMKYAC